MIDIKSLLRDLNNAKASDLLLVAGNPPCLRVNNNLVRQGNAKLSSEDIEALVMPLVPKAMMDEFKKTKELDIGYGDEHSRYRINLHYQSGGMAAAIRRISNVIPTLEELGLPSMVKDFTLLERGLVLITGPTGSGKSTTQASMIDTINARRACHIITVEDPI
ncbi:MAG: ATPase, T2SS/T4P/T4SS family, partial [Candidatus Margulisiibacteriota bacterium]